MEIIAVITVRHADVFCNPITTTIGRLSNGFESSRRVRRPAAASAIIRASMSERDAVDRLVGRDLDEHNRWYPVERDLPMNPRTGEYVPVAGRSYRRPVLGPAWVLEQFPPAADER